MEIWTLASDTDAGTEATVHMTEREAHLHLIQENVREDNREEAIKQLDRDGEDGFDFWEWFDENERDPMDTFSIESHTIDVPAPLTNPSDLVTTLVALRLFQKEYEDFDSVAIAEAWPEHFSIEGEGEDRTVTPQPLGTEDIDDLCERLTLGPEQPKESDTLVLLREFVSDVEAVGYAQTCEEWPDLAITYGKAKKLIAAQMIA